MSIPVCKFYSLNQTCRFGKHCRYLHSVSQRPPPHFSKSSRRKDEEFVKDPSSLETQRFSDQYNNPIADHHEESVISKPVEPCQTSSAHQDLSLNQKEGQDAASVVKNSGTRPARKAICHYFATYGNCRYGNECRFSHHLPNGGHGYRYNHAPWRNQRNRGGGQLPPRFRKAEENQQDTSAHVEQHDDEDIKSGQISPTDGGPDVLKEQGSQTPIKGPTKHQARQRSKAERRLCPFFKSGCCNRGERCRFRHPHELHQEKENAGSAGVRQAHRPDNSYRPIGLRQTFTYAELDEAGPAKVRESEVNTIRKRFPQDKITVVEEGDKFSARIKFSPSDPDWPFDIGSFELLLTIPEEYPRKMMEVRLPTDQDLPETVRRYVEVSIKEWLDHKAEQLALGGKVELVFRPFLRWLDRNIEEIITEALKQLKRELVARAAGMEFIPAERLQAKFRAKSESSGGEDKPLSGSEEEEEDNGSDDEESSEEEDSSEEESSSDEAENEDAAPSLDLDPEKKGTEISLKHLQLRENASSLLFERLKLVVQCGRCKNHADLAVSQGRVVSLKCEKCSQNQFVNFRPALIHQFSSVLGYLDVDGCQAFDLILQDSRAAVTCMACSKQTRIDGLVTGQMVDGWCQACNARFKLATEAVKFSHLVPSGIDTTVNKVVEVAPSKPKKPPKDPAIKEGMPLPEFGTCKHYKHSYRWLRFPCCGKAYPCDICHDKKENHEMVLANRMICGHCCKEQNFAATRPCNACGQHLTKIRSAHWEGGAGCRDKITMSKNDQQKYKNMNKTQSKHQKKVQSGASKKKVTKLRHT